jgi:hypothetical protein
MNDMKDEDNKKVPRSASVPKRIKKTPSANLSKTQPQPKPGTTPPQGGVQSYTQQPYGYAPPYLPPGAQVHHHYYYEAPRPPKKKSSKPTIAGALLILTAIIGLIGGVAIIGAGAMFSTADTEGFTFFGESGER